jgi:ribosome maturation factor RimP
VFVDRPEGGLTVGDCAGLSRGVAAGLEAADVVPGSFTLEVSSPGLDRPLTRPEQFPRFCGERVAIVVRGDGPDRRRIEGILESCTPADVTVVTDDGRRQVIRFEEMAKARRIADPWRGRGGVSGRRGARKGK